MKKRSSPKEKKKNNKKKKSTSYDETNKGCITTAGWQQMVCWCTTAANTFNISSWRKCLLDIGCGEGHVLKYAVAATATTTSTDNNNNNIVVDVGFERALGVENDPRTDYLPELKDNKKVTIFKDQDASDTIFLCDLFEKNFVSCIVWNGLKFADKTRGIVINTIANHANVGTLIFTNVVFPQSFKNVHQCFKAQFSCSMTDTELVSWSQNCEWYLYVVMPPLLNTIDSSKRNTYLPWIFEAFGLYYSLKESKEGTGEGGEPTIADIKRWTTKHSITRDAKAELCRKYFGTSTVVKTKKMLDQSGSNATILLNSKKRKREFCDEKSNIIPDRKKRNR